MTKVRVLQVAQREFRDAFHWYRDHNARTGKRFALEVKAAIASIRTDPERHARWDDVYRYYLVNRFHYYVAYRVSSDVVTIVAIRHGAQDQDAWQGR